MTITKIDGQPIAEVVSRLERSISAATPQWMQYLLSNALLSGPPASSVTLELQFENEPPRSVKLQREVYPGEIRGSRPDPFTELQPGVWYVDLERLKDGELTEQRIAELAKARGVIFDVRGYPGGEALKVLRHLTAETMTCARWHVPIVTHPDRVDMTFDFSNWPVAPAEPRIRAKVAFLTDGRAISYAETVLGIVEHYKLGEIVGGPTAGTNGNVNPFHLAGGYRLSWTGMKVLKHDGSQHHGIGIQPTVAVSPTTKGIAEGRDEVLEKGIEVVTR